jgi:hypothetical protein
LYVISPWAAALRMHSARRAFMAGVVATLIEAARNAAARCA